LPRPGPEPRLAHGLSTRQPRARAIARRRLVFDVSVNAIQQAFTAQLSQTAVKVFPDWQKNS
jgi:hypothetical protein